MNPLLPVILSAAKDPAARSPADIPLDAGFFAKPQNDRQGNVHFTVPTDGLRWVGRLMMAARAVHLSAPLNGPVFFAASK